MRAVCGVLAGFGAGVALWIVGVWAVVNYQRWKVAQQ